MNIDKLNKKIIVVSQFWPPNFAGGGELSTYYVCKQLIKMGYKITVITPNPSSDKEFEFIKTIQPHWFYGYFERIYFSKIIVNHKLDNGIFWASDYYGAAFLHNKNVKKVVTVRDHWPIYQSIQNILKLNEIIDSNIQKKITRIFRYLYNRRFRSSILQQFNHTVFVSNYIAQKIILSVPLKNYSVIYNPVSSEFMKKDSLKKFVNKNIIFIGHVKKSKGVDIILKAMQILVKHDKKFNLIIIGEGDLDKYNNIVNKLSLSNNVKFEGRIKNKDIIKYYDRSAFVVIPGLASEAFGRPVIEGMSRKCITISTNQWGPAEIIKNAENGFLFEKGNYNQLAKIIINVYQDTEMMNKIQENARNFAIKNFSPDRIAEQYERIFDKI